MRLQTIRDIDVRNKVVLLRADYNVPLDEEQNITSDLRIVTSLPTLQYLLDNGAKKIVIISHLGRPEGEDEKLSLRPVAARLAQLLNEKVGFAPLPKAPLTNQERVVLLENLRFDVGEEQNSPEFIKNIIDQVAPDFYVQDGFAVIHRAHASTDAVAKFLPVYAGLLIENEVEKLSKATENPEHPFVVIIGGSKIEDKQPLIEKFLNTADKIIVGGKIAADGYEAKDDKIYVAEDFDEDLSGAKLDIGPLATVKIAEILKDAKTVVWNGLLGKAEDPAYATSSTVVAEILGETEGINAVICGGDTTGFVTELLTEHANLSYSLISTGGGAALEFLLGQDLPGLKAIKKAN